jgi:PAS domain S-box-containing protein
MTNRGNSDTQTSDTLLFPDEAEDKAHQAAQALPPWEIIIADDQDEIHSIIKLVLDDFRFEDRPVKCHSAYSGAETKALVRQNPRVALILLDVVMETDDAGLDVVRYIREDLKNKIVQIVLNTGQPGQAPEHEIITKYGINDYKSKTEFNARKLITTLVSSLRAYSLSQSLHSVNQTLDQYRGHLEELVKARTAALTKANKKLETEVKDRRRAQKALKHSNEIQNQLLDASPTGICLLARGTIEWINDEMYRLFAFGHDTRYEKQRFDDLFPSKEEFQRVSERITASLKKGQSINIDAHFQRKDGSTFPGHLKISSHDPLDYLAQSIVTVSDISWRKQAEKDRVQRERLQGALEMSGSICHELNQPLQYISGASELMMMDMAKDDPFYETLSRLKEQVEKMGTITRKLMGLTKYQTMEYVGGRKIIDIHTQAEQESAESMG